MTEREAIYTDPLLRMAIGLPPWARPAAPFWYAVTLHYALPGAVRVLCYLLHTDTTRALLRVPA